MSSRSSRSNTTMEGQDAPGVDRRRKSPWGERMSNARKNMSERAVRMNQSVQEVVGASPFKTVEYVARWIMFLVYAAAAISLFAVSVQKDACHVQYTYKQEFVVNIVSNPFFSSSSIVRKAPLSKLEISYYNATNYIQRAADVGMFPNVIKDVYNNSAFWPVVSKPRPMYAADELITLSKLEKGTYYFDPATNEVVGNGIPVQGGVGAAFKNMMLAYVKGRWRPGMQLPNFARCNRKYMPPEETLYGTSAADQQALGTWLTKMMRFEKNSHLRGTCLLTGQQATVDMTSNYKTSVTLFSSVNVIFMLAVLLWITASFALFYIGGSPKVKDEDQVNDVSSWTLDDIFMTVAIVWNVVAIIYIIAPDPRVHSNIPLNNAVIAIVALLATIFVQWKWANFHRYDTDKHDGAALDAHLAVNENTIPRVADIGDSDEMQPTGPFNSAAPYSSSSSTNMGASSFIFNTANFLSTATAVQKYGPQYAKFSDSGDSKLRNRKGAAGASSSAVTGTRISKMPNYTAMLETGSPVVIYNYINNIKKEMHNDSVQSMEYTITTPLLSATLLAAASPTVPTGMVQWVFATLFVSHVLCIPILYLSHLSVSYRQQKYAFFAAGSMNMCIALLLVACVVLQINAFTIKFLYLTGSWDYYTVDGLLSGSAYFLLIMQIFFLLTVMLVAISSMMSSSKMMDTLAMWSSLIYTVINMLIKFVIGCMLASAAVNKNFPVFSCDIWEGRYASPDPMVA